MAEHDLFDEPARAHDPGAPLEHDSAAEAEFFDGDPRAAARSSESAPPGELPPVRWRTPLVLFALTLLSVFVTGAMYATPHLDPFGDPRALLRALPSGWSFAVPLMSILLCHELGHYFAARYHRVPASLPFFIPVPLISPFGTMGAVIGMRGRIRSRDALLDIGAAGPLAGLVVALPVLLYGLSTSNVEPLTGQGVQEGQSLLYVFLKRIVLGPIPVDHDVMLNPIAFAGWSGLFVTALNLLPVGQLDGGHVAYALLGPRQDKLARVIHWSLLVVFAYNLARFMLPVLRTRRWGEAGQAVSNSVFWLMWFGLLHLLARASGKNHPPTDPGHLSPLRKIIAAVTLLLFVLLFMPTPWAVY